MKPEIIERSVETNLPNSSKQFTIESSAKAFQILSANLYSDRIRAIVRELSTNALDAHIMVGKQDVPFKVSLPDSFTPQFIVKDEGTGLSHDGVMGLYTTYFGSDKTHTNELIGGLGLGSKSPFSYVDTFSIISRYKGMKRTYSAYLDGTRLPNITLMASTECEDDEPDGLEVIVPVDAGDFLRFETAAAAVFQHFPVSPTGIRTITQPKWTLVTDTCKVLENSYSARHNQVVVMGCVPYEIPSEMFDDPMDEIFLRMRSQFQAPVGSLNFQPSREKLSMDDKTEKNLRQIITRARVEVQYEIEFAMCAVETKLEAMVKAEAFGLSVFTWKGKECSSDTTFHAEHFTMHTWRNQLHRRTNISLSEVTSPDIHLFHLTHRSRLREILEYNDIDIGNCRFIINRSSAHALAAHFEIPELPSVSDLKIPPRKKAVSDRVVKLKTYHGYSWNELQISLKDIDESDTEYTWTEMNKDIASHKPIVDFMHTSGSATIIGVPRTLKYMEKKMPCPHIKKTAQAWLTQFFSISYNFSAYKLWDEKGSWFTRAAFSNPKLDKLEQTNPHLADFIKLNKFVRNKNTLFRQIKYALSHDEDLHLPKTKPQIANVTWNRFSKLYPTLSGLVENDSYHTIDIEHFKHYMSFIERRRK